MPILAYHKVNNKLEWGINTVSVRSFEKHIKYLYDHRFYTISLADRLAEDYQDDDERRPIIITFDDADESVYQHAYPILKRYGFKATLFVISNFVGKSNTWDANLGGIYSRHVSWEQIKELVKDGWEIGSHTKNHPDLTGLSREQTFSELINSKLTISEKIGKPVDFISYPFNRFNEEVVTMARDAGYTGGCALSFKLNLPKNMSHFALPRFGVYAIDTIRTVQRKLNDSGVEKVKQGVISFFSIGTIWYNQLKKRKKILLF